MDPWLEKSTEELFTTLLKKISASELKSFVEESARRQDLFRHRFIVRFIESTNIPSGEKYSLLARSIFQLAETSQEEFDHEVLQFLNRAQQFIAARDYLDSFYMAVAFITELKPNSEAKKNHSASYFEKTFELLASISKSEAGFDLKEKVYLFLLYGIRSAAKDFGTDVKEMWIQSLINAASEESQLQQVLDLIVELIGENRSQLGQAMDETDEERLLTVKLQVLQLLNRDDDVRHLLHANIRVKSFRFKLIDDLIRHHLWEDAKELIKEGRRHELRKGAINVRAEWDELLLRIAEEENDVKSIRNLAFQLFLSSDYDFKYYYLLKQHYDSSKWLSQVDRIILSMRKEKSFSTKGIYSVSKILIEEQAWDKLLTLVEKNANLDFVEQYADYLKEKFPDELLEIYRKAIRRFAEKYLGPEAYRVVVSALKKMQSIPGSKEIVQSLAIELKVTYRQRRAMVEELNKVIL